MEREKKMNLNKMLVALMLATVSVGFLPAANAAPPVPPTCPDAGEALTYSSADVKFSSGAETLSGVSNPTNPVHKEFNVALPNGENDPDRWLATVAGDDARQASMTIYLVDGSTCIALSEPILLKGQSYRFYVERTADAEALGATVDFSIEVDNTI